MRPLSAGAAILGALALLAGCAGSTPPSRDQLINIHLGPAYSQWLIGPIVRMSSREEVETYMALRDDAAAAGFIASYWERRGPAAKGVFDERAAEADRRFSEGGYSGRRTDRGSIFVLHGPPREINFEAPAFINEPPVEAWYYDTGGTDLNGKPPAGVYRFAKYGDLTAFYRPRVRRVDETEPIR